MDGARPSGAGGPIATPASTISCQILDASLGREGDAVGEDCGHLRRPGPGGRAATATVHADPETFCKTMTSGHTPGDPAADGHPVGRTRSHPRPSPRRIAGGG